MSFDQIGFDQKAGSEQKIKWKDLNATCFEFLFDVAEAISSLSRLSYLIARFLNGRWF